MRNRPVYFIERAALADLPTKALLGRLHRLRELVDNHFQLALHGHQHVDWQETHTFADGSLHIASGASVGVARYGRQNWSLPLGYQVLVLDASGRGRRIRREYDPARREWTAAGRSPDVQLFTLPIAAERLRRTS